VYSTLDDKDTPTFGATHGSIEPSFKALGGAEDYRHYEVEIKGFIPLDNARYISVFRLMYNQTLGDKVPFWNRVSWGARPPCAAMAASGLRKRWASHERIGIFWCLRSGEGR